ncbi:MAG: G5 domain-containing protein [Oscillospiraceae bacterium]|nr:G5 domain-containing protein [Oscillospiraceae bacterium]
MHYIAPSALRRNSLLKLVAMVLAAVCLVGTLSRTAKAENTFVITDGDAVKVHTTTATDPAKVLKEAGVALAKDDFYTTAEGDGVSEINVQRSQSITVYNGSAILQATSYGETLQALFDRLGITVDESVVVSVPLDTMTYNGMQVRVDSLGEGTERYTVEVPFETVYKDDPTLPKGQEKLLVQGKPGQKLCTATVTYVNGQEDSRTVLDETVTIEPVNQVIAVGTGEQAAQKSDKPVIGDGYIMLPTGEVLTYTHTDQFVATAYTHFDAGCDLYTANGARVKWGVVAVDPKVIPYGTRMFIVANDGSYVYGLSTAEDCGGAIQNKRLDLYMPTLEQAFQFGIRNCTVYFLGDADWRDNA